MAEAKKTTKKAVKTVKEEKVVAPAIEAVEPVEVVEASVEAAPKAIAKAGKRSVKAIKETEEKIAKEERKAHASEVTEEPVFKAVPKARTHAERAGKKYREAFAKVEQDKEYGLKEAVALAIATSPTKFDASIEVHVRLNVDPRQADQNIRSMIVLPEGTGKQVRVAVFGDVEDVAAAKKAGADVAGSEDFLQQLDKGVIDFDVLVATPMMMAKLGKYARILGPKGLMPNPKSGTVTKDVAKAVKEAKAGRVEFRVDSTGIVHIAVGKVSFGADRVMKNVNALMTSLKGAKPSSIKGTYVKSIFVTSSMGPSVKVLSSEL